MTNKRGRKEGNILFNDALDTFYLWLYGVGHNGKGPFRYLGYYFRLAARVLLYAPFYRQVSAHHGLC